MADPESAVHDLAVVGAGVVGLAAAREVLERRPGLNVLVLDREVTLAAHQSSHNSGVVHAGIYYQPGSLKAKLCVEGSRRLLEYCDEKGVPYRVSGKLIVATTNDELGRLDDLERRARANGVTIARVSQQQIADFEPYARGVAALHSPRTAVVDFAAVGRALADDIAAGGGIIRLGEDITSIERTDHGFRLVSASGAFRARRVLCCAGAWSDRLAATTGSPRDPRIIPFRGQYLRLRKPSSDYVRALIYPVPDPRLPFLGVHLTRTLSDEVLVGPTALLVGARDGYRGRLIRPNDLRDIVTWPGAWRMAARWWKTGLQELVTALSSARLMEDARCYVPALSAGDAEPGPSGVRAQAVSKRGELVDDFVVSDDPTVMHIRNAPSPAATASMAIAELIADRFDYEVR